MDYQTTVGIEVHCELKTNTKMFSNSKNGYGDSANSNINEIDLAYPGSLPILNEGAVLLALRAALVLNCKINQKMHFDRKNYFYPDLPKGYQITQARTPIGVDGYVEINVDGKQKKVRIHDIHIEEDTAKSVHTTDVSLLDYNRAGVPLVEIVTEADMNSSEEAMAYVEALRELLLYADISDCKIEEGSMRCDVNVSVSKSENLGTRTEIKNVSSISNVGLAIKEEAKRQIEVLEAGGVIREETRRFDEKANKTVLLRVKETGNDYRYFPEADIPFLILTDEVVDQVKSNIPILPVDRRKLYRENGVSEININKLIQNRSLSDYLLDAKEGFNYVLASNILLGDVSSYLNKTMKKIEDTKLDINKLTFIMERLENGSLTNKILKEILEELLETDEKIDTIIEKHGITQVDDKTELLNVVKRIMEENPESVSDYKAGKDRALKYLMGQIMKETKGGANPQVVSELLMEELKK